MPPSPPRFENAITWPHLRLTDEELEAIPRASEVEVKDEALVGELLGEPGVIQIPCQHV